MDRLHFLLPTEVIAAPNCVLQTSMRWICGRKALIVTGKTGAKSAGALADVTKALEIHGVAFVQFDGVESNPSAEQIYSGATIAHDQECDFVIGVGGGSVLDAAKAIAWVVGSKIPREQFFARKPGGSDCVLPIVAIPLTCGTGSEVTPYSIITDHEVKTKVNISSVAFFPKFALLDARYVESLPLQVVCDTALDALSHAVEGAYSLKADTFSLAMSEEAIRKIVPELVRLAHGAYVNRGELLYASMVAGIVIAQTGTGLVHAMGYPLTYYRNVPHGRANGLLLAGYLAFMGRSCGPLTSRLLQVAGLESPETLLALVDALFDTLQCEREAPSEEELVRFAREPLRLDVVRRYRAMPSPNDVMDIYRMAF